MKRLKQVAPDDFDEFTDQPMLYSLHHNIGNMPGFPKVGDFVEVRMKDGTLEQHVIVCFQTSRFTKGFYYKTGDSFTTFKTPRNSQMAQTPKSICFGQIGSMKDSSLERCRKKFMLSRHTIGQSLSRRAKSTKRASSALGGAS